MPKDKMRNSKNNATFVPVELNSIMYDRIASYCVRYGYTFDGNRITCNSESKVYVDFYSNKRGKSFLIIYDGNRSVKMDANVECPVDNHLTSIISSSKT
jgi:hypothetical protein